MKRFIELFEVKKMNIPEGMLPVEEYAKRNGIDVDIVITRIRDAEYIGRKN